LLKLFEKSLTFILLCGMIAIAIWQKQVELRKLFAGSRKTLEFQGQVVGLNMHLKL